MGEAWAGGGQVSLLVCCSALCFSDLLTDAAQRCEVPPLVVGEPFFLKKKLPEAPRMHNNERSIFSMGAAREPNPLRFVPSALAPSKVASLSERRAPFLSMAGQKTALRQCQFENGIPLQVAGWNY